jgi:hypothetical protein
MCWSVFRRITGRQYMRAMIVTASSCILSLHACRCCLSTPHQPASLAALLQVGDQQGLFSRQKVFHLSNATLPYLKGCFVMQ